MKHIQEIINRILVNKDTPTPEEIEFMAYELMETRKLLREYQEIGTVEECRDCVGYFNAPEIESENEEIVCPNCGLITELANGASAEDPDVNVNFCSRCGVKL